MWVHAPLAASVFLVGQWLRRSLSLALLVTVSMVWFLGSLVAPDVFKFAFSVLCIGWEAVLWGATDELKEVGRGFPWGVWGKAASGGQT